MRKTIQTCANCSYTTTLSKRWLTNAPKMVLLSKIRTSPRTWNHSMTMKIRKNKRFAAKASARLSGNVSQSFIFQAGRRWTMIKINRQITSCLQGVWTMKISNKDSLETVTLWQFFQRWQRNLHAFMSALAAFTYLRLESWNKKSNWTRRAFTWSTSTSTDAKKPWLLTTKSLATSPADHFSPRLRTSRKRGWCCWRRPGPNCTAPTWSQRPACPTSLLSIC